MDMPSLTPKREKPTIDQTLAKKVERLKELKFDKEITIKEIVSSQLQLNNHFTNLRNSIQDIGASAIALAQRAKAEGLTDIAYDLYQAQKEIEARFKSIDVENLRARRGEVPEEMKEFIQFAGEVRGKLSTLFTEYSIAAEEGIKSPEATNMDLRLGNLGLAQPLAIVNVSYLEDSVDDLRLIYDEGVEVRGQIEKLKQNKLQKDRLRVKLKAEGKI